MASQKISKNTLPVPEEAAPPEDPELPGSDISKTPPTGAIRKTLRGHLKQAKNVDSKAVIGLDDTTAARRAVWGKARKDFQVALEALIDAREWATIEEIRQLHFSLAELLWILPGLKGLSASEAKARIKVVHSRIHDLQA